MSVVHLHIAHQLVRRGKRRALVSESTFSRHKKDLTPLQRALVRGHQWLVMLESGEVTSLTELAQREGMDRAYVSRLVNLTTLAPDIVLAMLDETLPAAVTLMDLASATPLLWEEQRELIKNIALRGVKPTFSNGVQS